MEWHDYFRILNLFICFAALVIMASRFAQNNEKWNTKTRDYWFAFVIWFMVGIASTVTALLRDAPLTPVPLFIFIASIVTLKGLMHKGAWGDPNEA